MSFRFRLAAVLKYRERQRDAQAAAVKQALAALHAARLQLRAQDEVVGRLLRCTERRDAPTGGSVDLWRQQASYLAYLRAELLRRRQAVDRAEGRWRVAQERLVAADRDCEILVRLARRQHDLWRAAQARRLQRGWDEIATVRAARQRAEKFAEVEPAPRLAIVAGVPEQG